MIQSFFIGCILPGLNEIIEAAKVRKGNWSKYAEMKAAYGALCKDDIKRANLKPCTNQVFITFRWCERNRKRDKDNITAGQKFILDALVARKILINDGWQQIGGINHLWFVDSIQVGVGVTLEEI